MVWFRRQRRQEHKNKFYAKPLRPLQDAKKLPMLRLGSRGSRCRLHRCIKQLIVLYSNLRID
jgi:hypothetical protein